MSQGSFSGESGSEPPWGSTHLRFAGGPAGVVQKSQLHLCDPILTFPVCIVGGSVTTDTVLPGGQFCSPTLAVPTAYDCGKPYRTMLWACLPSTPWLNTWIAEQAQSSLLRGGCCFCVLWAARGQSLPAPSMESVERSRLKGRGCFSELDAIFFLTTRWHAAVMISGQAQGAGAKKSQFFDNFLLS